MGGSPLYPSLAERDHKDPRASAEGTAGGVCCSAPAPGPIGGSEGGAGSARAGIAPLGAIKQSKNTFKRARGSQLAYLQHGCPSGPESQRRHLCGKGKLCPCGHLWTFSFPGGWGAGVGGGQKPVVIEPKKMNIGEVN